MNSQCGKNKSAVPMRLSHRYCRDSLWIQRSRNQSLELLPGLRSHHADVIYKKRRRGAHLKLLTFDPIRLHANQCFVVLQAGRETRQIEIQPFCKFDQIVFRESAYVLSRGDLCLPEKLIMVFPEPPLVCGAL